MTARSSFPLRDTFSLLLIALLTIVSSAQVTHATPTDRAAAEAPDPAEAVRVLPPVAVAEGTAVTSFSPSSPAASRTASAAMPLERDINTLRELRGMLKQGDAETRGQVAHRVTILAAGTENVPYLRPLRPELMDMLFDYSAPEKNRLMALAALYKISPKVTLHSVQARIDREPSDRVRTTMENVVRGGWTPEMGLM